MQSAVSMLGGLEGSIGSCEVVDLALLRSMSSVFELTFLFHLDPSAIAFVLTISVLGTWGHPGLPFKHHIFLSIFNFGFGLGQY